MTEIEETLILEGCVEAYKKGQKETFEIAFLEGWERAVEAIKVCIPSLTENISYYYNQEKKKQPSRVEGIELEDFEELLKLSGEIMSSVADVVIEVTKHPEFKEILKEFSEKAIEG